jgi:hypothetical protein
MHDSLTPTSPPASPTTIKLDLLQQRSEAQRETRARRIDFAWRILLPAAAESLISEFLPSAKTEAGIDLASTFANTLGAFLEGDSIDQRVAASLTHSLSLHSLALLTPSLIHSLTNNIRVPSLHMPTCLLGPTLCTSTQPLKTPVPCSSHSLADTPNLRVTLTHAPHARTHARTQA